VIRRPDVNTAMPNLLILNLTPERREMLFPWEQHDALRVALDLHARDCTACEMDTLTIFDTYMRRDAFTAKCVEGARVGEMLWDARDGLRGRG
jgi:hypothetical protein